MSTKNPELTTNEVTQKKSDSGKKVNKNLILGIVAIVAVLILIILVFFDSKQKQQPPAEFEVKEETQPAQPSPDEAFVEVDIDRDGDKERVPQKVANSRILLLTKDGELYTINPVDLKRTLLLEDVAAFSSSEDKKNIAYLKTCSETVNTSQCDNNIYIFNIETGTTGKIESASFSQRNVYWSPDGKYILVEMGTGAIGLTRVFSVADGKETECSFSGDFLWINDHELVTNLFLDGYAIRPGEINQATGVRKINVETCESENIILPSDTEDFHAVKVIDGNLIVEKRYVAKKEDWVDFKGESKIQTTHEKYNLQTKTREPYPSYAEELRKENSRIKSLLPDYINSKSIFISDKEIAEGWELVNVYTGGSIFNNIVFLIGPDKTAAKIDEGAVGRWL